MSIENFKARIHEREHPEKVSFWFVRHEESDENTKGSKAVVMHDTPLTDTGVKGAESLADYLVVQGVNFTHIYSSSRLRAKQTAKIIGARLNLPVIIKAELDERDWGEYRNQPWEEVSAKLEGMSTEDRYQHIPPGGESWRQMEHRKLQALEEIAEETKNGGDVIIVEHTGTLRATLPLLAKAGREKHQEFSVPLGSISKFGFDKDEFDFIGLKPGDK